jgi:multicomponent Na+:H+ antiporter subunit E
MLTVILATIFSGLWWLLSNGSADSWTVGLPVVVAATLVGQSLMDRIPVSIRLQGLISFIVFFIYESIRGGIDVARRTLPPRMNIQPHFYYYQTHIQQPMARILFCNSISLLPGTLCVQMQGDQIEIHALSSNNEVEKELTKLENKVLAIFKPTGNNDE